MTKLANQERSKVVMQRIEAMSSYKQSTALLVNNSEKTNNYNEGHSESFFASPARKTGKTSLPEISLPSSSSSSKILSSPKPTSLNFISLPQLHASLEKSPFASPPPLQPTGEDIREKNYRKDQPLLLLHMRQNETEKEKQLKQRKMYVRRNGEGNGDTMENSRGKEIIH
jgi:hypothetical protein